MQKSQSSPQNGNLPGPKLSNGSLIAGPLRRDQDERASKPSAADLDQIALGAARKIAALAIRRETQRVALIQVLVADAIRDAIEWQNTGNAPRPMRIVTKAEYDALKMRPRGATSRWIRTGRISPEAIVPLRHRKGSGIWVERADDDLAKNLDPGQQRAQDFPIATTVARSQ
jgi:hypothetical protein